MSLDSLTEGNQESFLSEYENLLKITNVVAAAIKVMTAQHDIERWETSTAIPILTETYNNLISLKKKISDAFLAASSGEVFHFTAKEKDVVKYYGSVVEQNKKILRTLFGICVDPGELS